MAEQVALIISSSYIFSEPDPSKQVTNFLWHIFNINNTLLKSSLIN
jgi:hypothetical protein